MIARDYSAMFQHARCVVCGRSAADREKHVSLHLACGTAVVLKAFEKLDRVVPTSTQPVKDTADDPNPPKLK